MADNTKYRFKGQEYGKGRLVLAVIKSTVTSAKLNFSDLKELLATVPFGRELVLTKVDYDQGLTNSDDISKRYFVGDPLTDASGELFYVSNQWGIHNIDGFVIEARGFGTEIEIIADPDSELIKFYNYHKMNQEPKWPKAYAKGCGRLADADPDTFDFDSEEFLETYWRSKDNGISGVGAGMLSHDDFNAIRGDLADISRKILSDPSASTLDEVLTWAAHAKDSGKLNVIRKAVIRRFFCACDPSNLTTILRADHLRRFVKMWNDLNYGQKIKPSSNWVELNSRILTAVKMRGLEREDIYLVNTFVYRLGEFFGDKHPNTFDGERVVENDKLDNSESSIPITSVSLNQILYGPPGTGKTFSTIKLAVDIIDPVLISKLSDSELEPTEQRETIKARFDKLVDAGQIAFTTFHQSFGYEDFVEGLKAEIESGQIAYSVADGIFKQICSKADPLQQASGLEDAILSLKEKCSEEVLTLRTSRGKAFALSYRGGKAFSCMPEASSTENDFSANVDHIKKMVMGETPENLYCGSYVKAIAKYLQDNYSIESVNAMASQRALPYVLIIDEINRGNIAKIFGELITLLEPGKRKGQAEALSVTLPYSKDQFSIPANLHLIGTMNTADTSLAKVDIALRRRFEFIEMMPNLDVLQDLLVEGVEVSRLLEAINQRIELLYDRDHTIGHSYFMGLSSGSSIADLAVVFERQIIPLLEEYFFEDWSLIHRVLGDHLKGPHQAKFIVKKYSESEIGGLMGPDWLGDNSIQPVWALNLESLQKASAYQGVYAPVKQQAAVEQNLDETQD